jgi:hypothetical protein
MSRTRLVVAAATLLAILGTVAPEPLRAAPRCSAEQTQQLVPTDPALCAQLLPAVQHPGAPEYIDNLAAYQEKLGEFLRNFCHRDTKSGWKRDKHVRDTGPFTATFDGSSWSGRPNGTHAPVVVWYSPEMVEWLHANRPGEGKTAPTEPTPVPNGAIMVKEMFPAPAAACAGVDPLKLLPTSGSAIMVRASGASQDGWFWGWFGWSGWTPDWPPDATNRYPFQGFGQYCLNCHSTARDNHTFASLLNMEGEPGNPLVFLSQHFFEPEPVAAHHRLVALPTDDAPRLGQPNYLYNRALTEALVAGGLPRPSWETVSQLPSQTYDEVWVEPGTVTARSQFITSSQCIGCHDAGATGLQFDMTAPNPHGSNLLNLSPYATWRTSPMGLGGRDPVFYAQLQSEIGFHPEAAETLQGVCMGCHGVAGQRQYEIDDAGRSAGRDGECPPFLREYASAVPWPADTSVNPGAKLAHYGALARDGINCPACHHMLAGEGPENPAIRDPQNRCVKERQDFLNPHNRGFAKTFTGSFLLGPPDQLYGPFADPKTKPMEAALGIKPAHTTAIQSSELCGSCHTVHLPVMVKGKVVAHVYEQGTYPEWAFSAYRTGDTPTGKLPGGAGARAQSCQACHMPSRDADGKPYRSKIAGIQEHSNFPQAEHALGPEDVDLPVREGFARHTLVGLNVFFVKMAQQFPDVLGIRTQDPMLVSRGLDPLLFTEQAMLDQASHATAKLGINRIVVTDGKIEATVRVESDVGHKFPSGVGFRRAFLGFEVFDAAGNVIWASGRTNGAGAIVDEAGAPIAGELWWKDDCSARLHPGELSYQPHYEVIRRQDQAQIYQELVSAPPPGEENPKCGLDVPSRPPLTTSFLSICGRVKDNRIQPAGLLPLAERIRIAKALGAGEDLARDVESFGVGKDPDYREGGGDSVKYEIELASLSAKPASVRATLYYQAIPPFYLQDRFCTSKSEDTQRLYFLAGHLNLQGTAAESWKLAVVSSGSVTIADHAKGR